LEPGCSVSNFLGEGCRSFTIFFMLSRSVSGFKMGLVGLKL
jgi:hypothetical protein